MFAFTSIIHSSKKLKRTHGNYESNKNLSVINPKSFFFYQIKYEMSRVRCLYKTMTDQSTL